MFRCYFTSSYVSSQAIHPLTFIVLNIIGTNSRKKLEKIVTQTVKDSQFFVMSKCLFDCSQCLT